MLEERGNINNFIGSCDNCDAVSKSQDAPITLRKHTHATYSDFSRR